MNIFTDGINLVSIRSSKMDYTKFLNSIDSIVDISFKANTDEGICRAFQLISNELIELKSPAIDLFEYKGGFDKMCDTLSKCTRNRHLMNSIINNHISVILLLRVQEEETLFNILYGKKLLLFNLSTICIICKNGMVKFLKSRYFPINIKIPMTSEYNVIDSFLNKNNISQEENKMNNSILQKGVNVMIVDSDNYKKVWKKNLEDYYKSYKMSQYVEGTYIKEFCNALEEPNNIVNLNTDITVINFVDSEEYARQNIKYFVDILRLQMLIDKSIIVLVFNKDNFDEKFYEYSGLFEISKNIFSIDYRNIITIKKNRSGQLNLASKYELYPDFTLLEIKVYKLLKNSSTVILIDDAFNKSIIDGIKLEFKNNGYELYDFDSFPTLTDFDVNPSITKICVDLTDEGSNEYTLRGIPISKLNKNRDISIVILCRNLNNLSCNTLSYVDNILTMIVTTKLSYVFRLNVAKYCRHGVIPEVDNMISLYGLLYGIKISNPNKIMLEALSEDEKEMSNNKSSKKIVNTIETIAPDFIEREKESTNVQRPKPIIFDNANYPKMVNRALFDEKLFPKKYAVEFIGDRQKFMFSACNVCLKCGMIHNINDKITVDLPIDFHSYNVVVTNNNTTCYRCGSKAFPCDPLIAQAVLNFNKNGYKTFSSCSGHVQNPIGRDLISSEGFGISPTYITFKGLDSKQKKKIINGINKYDLNGVYLFECNQNRYESYYDGNIFVISTNTPWNYRGGDYEYKCGVCYELSSNELIGFLHGSILDVASEDIGFNIIKNNCQILECVSKLIPEIKKSSYDIVSRKERWIDTKNKH